MCSEKCDITVWPVMICIYLFVCNSMQSHFRLIFKPSFCNSARSQLKCKTGMKEPVYHWRFIKYSWCLVPFNSNIYCHRPHSISVLAMIKTRVPISVVLYFSGIHGKKIMLQNMPSLYVPVPATLGRVNKASVPVMFICYYELLRTARCICEGN